MSHVVSCQPSATSPYQPTATQDIENGRNDNQPRIHGTNSEYADDCCIHTRNRSGICLAICKVLTWCCNGIKNCTEICCDNCANCLNDCCEDKPAKQRKQRRYRSGSYYDNAEENNADWGTTSMSVMHTNVGISDSHGRSHTQTGHDTGTEISTHGSTAHHSSNHDSGMHHSSNHDSGTHHTSTHDTCESSATGGDSGGACDSGGGDCGGGSCD